MSREALGSERGRNEKETKVVGVQIPKFMRAPVPRLQSLQWSMMIIGRRTSGIGTFLALAIWLDGDWMMGRSWMEGMLTL